LNRTAEAHYIIAFNIKSGLEDSNMTDEKVKMIESKLSDREENLAYRKYEIQLLMKLILHLV
jgi:hypothetical protein